MKIKARKGDTSQPASQPNSHKNAYTYNRIFYVLFTYDHTATTNKFVYNLRKNKHLHPILSYSILLELCFGLFDSISSTVRSLALSLLCIRSLAHSIAQLLLAFTFNCLSFMLSSKPIGNFHPNHLQPQSEKRQKNTLRLTHRETGENKKRNQQIAATQQIERDEFGVIWCDRWWWWRGIRKQTHENPFRFSAKIPTHREITKQSVQWIVPSHTHYLVWFYWFRVCVCSFYEFAKSFSASRVSERLWIQRKRIASSGVLNLPLPLLLCVLIPYSHLQSLTNFISLVALWWNQFECVHDFMQTARMNLNV